MLDYNAQNIFNFLHNDIGYNSYTGSLRGARGTLWSSAGNALDVASLGVALMRASGIPAQYVEGTLSTSPGPATHPVDVPGQLSDGRLHPGRHAQLSDPANDSQLQSETESHYWFQFNAGNGWVNADPLMARSPDRADVHGGDRLVHRSAAEPAPDDRGAAHGGDL